MRALIVDQRVNFLNPNAQNWPLLFAGRHSPVFFGPGFVSDDVLNEGLTRFVKKSGPYDVCVASYHVLYPHCDPQTSNEYWSGFKTNFDFSFSLDTAKTTRAALFSDFLEFDGPRIVSHLAWDSYRVPRGHVDLLHEASVYVLGWGEQFLKEVVSCPDLPNEAFSDSANDLWVHFVRTHRNRIISIPGFVTADEFDFTPVITRPIHWSVAGTRYWRRQRAFSVLRAMGVHPRGANLDVASRALGVARTHGVLGSWGISISQMMFRRLLRESRYSYTCGSGLDVPIRKFFEIPAAGSVLVCTPFAGHEACGFVGGETCIVGDPEQLPEVHKMLTSSPGEAERIADMGRELIWQRHSLRARQDQVRLAVDAIHAKGFHGSYWEASEFHVADKSDASVKDP